MIDRRTLLLGAAFAPLAAGSVFGQTAWPDRALRIIVPFGPGAFTDIAARLLAVELTEQLGQTVFVENRGGAGGTAGTTAVVRAEPDGYTLLLTDTSLSISPGLNPNLAYDPLRDFSPVLLTARSAGALVVHPSVPARTLKEFIAFAKARPGQLTYASSGNGTSPHLSGELFKSMAGIQMLHIPYKGAGPAINDLLGGHVAVAFVSFTSVVAHLKANRLRALAITSDKRSPLMPELPTFGEAGLPGFVVYGWYGVVVALLIKYSTNVPSAAKSTRTRLEHLADNYDCLSAEKPSRRRIEFHRG